MTVPALFASAEHFRGPQMATGKFDRDTGARLVAAGGEDLIGYRSSFIAHLDLVERFRRRAPSAAPNVYRFYTPGPQGYTDYRGPDHRTVGGFTGHGSARR